MVKSGAQSLTFKRVTVASVTDRKSVTDRQKKLNVFRRPGGGLNPIATKLGKVIEDLEHILSPPTRLGF